MILTNHISYLPDPHNTLKIQKILDAEGTLKFEPYKSDQILTPQSTYWLKVVIDNQLPDTRILRDWKLFVGDVDLFEVYKVSDSQLVMDSLYGGRLYPSKNKLLKVGNKFSRVNISIEDNHPISLYLKIRRINHQPFDIDLRLAKNDFFQSWNYVKQSRVDWFFLGFIITMVVFSFMFYKGTGDPAFLYHGFFILGVILFTLEFFAITHDLFLVRDFPRLKVVVDYIGIAILDISYFQFIRYYLNLDTLLPKWDRFFKQLLLLKIVYYPLTIIGYFLTYNVPIVDKFVATFLISQFIIVTAFLIPLFRTKDKKGLFLIVGSLLLFAGILLNGTSVILGKGLFLIFTLTGIVGEILCFSLGLGYRMKELQTKAIEEERKTNIRLREIDKLKDQFLANTSHELKNTSTRNHWFIRESSWKGRGSK